MYVLIHSIYSGGGFDVFVISVKNEKIKIEEDYSSSAINASIPNAAHSGHTQSSGMSAGVAPAGILYAGSPFSVSNLYSQCKQTYIVILLSPYFFISIANIILIVLILIFKITYLIIMYEILCISAR